MSNFKKYREIYCKVIGDAFREQILVYDIVSDHFSFHPFSHNCEKMCKTGCANDCYKSLGDLMRKNLVFYAYGESEIVENIENGLFSQLEDCINYTYKNRLPKRDALQDGLPGEVLFDLILQNIVPNAFKMSVRTIFRQDDNNEIKGYDLTYLTNENGQITLWLGQAKLGAEKYCKNGIHNDLTDKFDKIYMSKQIYFLADKPHGLTDEAKAVNVLINKVNMLNQKKREDEMADDQRASALLKFLDDEKISINIPCLLAYGKGCVYNRIDDVKKNISKEVESLKKYYKDKSYNFLHIKPKIMFFIFPIESLSGLRGNEGFYCGL